MVPQDFEFFLCQVNHEIGGKAADTPLHCPFQRLRLHAVKFRQVRVKLPFQFLDRFFRRCLRAVLGERYGGGQNRYGQSGEDSFHSSPFGLDD